MKAQNTFRKNLLVGFTASLLILFVSSTASYISIRNLLESNALVAHTQQVIYNVNEASIRMVEAQTSMRGYLITGRDEFLEQYSDADSDVQDFIGVLGELGSGNPVQQRNIAELQLQKDKFFSYLERRVADKKQGRVAATSDLEAGRKIMDDMRRIFKRMENNAEEQLKERSANSAKYGLYSSVLIIVAAIIAMLISIMFFVRILRDYNTRAVLQRKLEDSERETSKRIHVISEISDQIANGNYDIRVDDNEKDALGSIGGAMNNMAQSLRQSFQSLSDRQRLQTGIAELNKVMIGEKDLHQLTTDIIEYLANYTGSSAALLYLPEGGALVRTAGYSYIPAKERERILIGDGLSGQAAASGKIMELKSLPQEQIKISYALGEMAPTHIVAVPLLDDKVSGVVELASAKQYTELDMEFLSTVANNIAIALTAAQNRKRVQELLEETEAQSEELRVQHSELESINAELETQSEKLQASEEELRVQQEELQQTNEELEERSMLLEEKNLEIQRKSEDLEISTRYKSEFLANMSHELRTPLNSILLLSRLLSENNESNLSAEQIEFAKVIQSSGNGLLGLIDEILDLSKIEAGKMELEVMDISTREISENMKGLFTEVAKQKNLKFIIDADDAPLILRSDKMRLEQILKNLISNALKFTSEGSVSLRIARHSTDDRFVCFSVKDTGIGIPHEKQPLIFEAFQQADGSTKRKYGGTGLGLSISRELAKLLKGELTVKSEVGSGSEFTLCLPLTENAAGTPATPVIEIRASAEMPSEETKYISKTIPDDVEDDRENLSSDDKVILIVEDDVNFAKSLLSFTRDRGYKGIVAVRGDQALNLTLAFNPVGILLDIQLPVKSGLEVMEELKANPQTRHIPVHIMSSHKLKQESMLKGAVNFMDKPVAYDKMPEIFNRIEYIINRKSQKVLIIEDNPRHAKALGYFLDNANINSEIRSEVSESIKALQDENVDCVILDMGIPDQQAYEVLENVKKTAGLENLPVIVFTGKSLSMKEEVRIKKYADSIVVKTAHSYQRMLDEVSLFLHLMEENKRGTNKGPKKHALTNVLCNKTVLVVDDDVRNIYSLTKALEGSDMKVVTAIDGKEALKALDQHPEIDVVLLDMMMPNMDGYETAEHIRQNKKHKNLPVIAVTAKAMTGDREKCINAGASDYITKPVDIDQLMSLLRVWLYDKS